MKAAILILSVILSVTVKVNGLQCYVCYDCSKPTDDSLLTCEDYASNSTTTTSSTTESTTATNTTNSTTTPSPSNTTSSTTTPTNTTSSTTTPTSTTSSTTTSTTTTTTTSTTAPDTNATDTNATFADEANMIYKSERADSYECFSGTINVSNTAVTVRGCAINPTNNTCAVSGMSDCKLCSTDKCNGATAVHSSAALLCLLFLALLCKE